MKKRYLIPSLAAAAAVIAGCLIYFLVPRLSAAPGTHLKYTAFLQGFFQQEITKSTLSMHYTVTDPKSYGISSYDVSFGDVSARGRERSLQELKNTRKSLKAFSYHKLSKSEQFLYDLLMDSLDSEIALSDYELFQEPFKPNNGIQSQLPVLLAEYTFYSASDVDDYLALLGQIDVYFSQLLDFESEKADAGYFMNDSQCAQVLTACEQFLSDRNTNLLLTSFENRIQSVEGLSEAERLSYIEKNREMFWEHVCPAYESIVYRMSALLGSGRNDGGLFNYENGKTYYELLVHSDTGTSETMDELFDKISAARDADLAVCTDIIAEHPEYADGSYDAVWNFANETEMLDALSDAMCSDFPALSDASYSVSYVEEALEDSLAPAFYITAPIDDCSTNRIYINRSKTSTDLSFFTTLAHEGFPGHLYQTVMSNQYGQNPVRALLDYPGYVEGWATYVEMQSYHYAGLPEELATLLSRNQSATLSLYATSDLGLHYYGWGKKELREFWAGYGITDSGTIDRIEELILSDPGNYLKYYVGYLKFEELRAEMERKYGDNFSAVKFHEAILRMGPAPFDLLQKYFPSYYSISGEA